MKKVLVLFAGFFGLIYWFTYGLLDTFFQQDEWNGFGLVIQLAQGPWIYWFGLLGPSHFIPLAQFFWFLLYRTFGFQAQYYALTALLLHTTASVLVYMLAVRLTKKPWIGILTAILFATNSRAGQTFSHLAIFPATITCFIVIMLFFLYVTHLEHVKVLKPKNLIVLLSIFFMSMLLREDGLILPALLPVYFWLYNRLVFQKKNVWFFAIFYGLVGLFVGFRVLLQVVNPTAISISSHLAAKIFFYNSVSLPFKLIVQNFFEGIDLYNLFWNNKQHIYTVFYNSINVAVMYTVFYDFIILIFFNLLTVTFWVSTRRLRDDTFWRNTMFGLAWIFISALLLAVLGRPQTVVESRYLYLSSFAVLFIFSQTLVTLFEIDNKNNIINLARKFSLAFIVVILLWYSYVELQITTKKYMFQSAAREHVLADLMRLYPTISKQTIFYVRCKNVCLKNIDYFGVPDELVLPFTSGPGWIFMLYYAQHNESAYAPFFAYDNGKQFLWDYAAEGYKRIGDYSFGYFITKPMLVETLMKQHLDPQIVIGLEYDYRDFSLHDISSTIRDELRHDIATMSGVLHE